MLDMDIIILSSIVVTLFIVFLGFVIREFIKMEKNPIVEPEKGGRVELIKFMGKLFDTPVKTDEEANQKIMMYKTIQRTIADMESDGVYFPENIKKELQKKREELKCEYSGLPSVQSYE